MLGFPFGGVNVVVVLMIVGIDHLVSTSLLLKNCFEVLRVILFGFFLEFMGYLLLVVLGGRDVVN